MSVSGCYQGVLGFKAAETRLTERDKDVKKGKYILSWLTKAGSVKHTTAPNPSARNNFHSYEEASSVMDKMILSNDE